MALCAKCGSKNTRLRKGFRIAGLLAFMLRQQEVQCNRCGWSGRVRRPSEKRRPERSRRAAEPNRSWDVAEEPDLQSIDRALAENKSTGGKR
jgi:hypothetical protein